MKPNFLYLFLFLFCTIPTFSQRFDIGDKVDVNPLFYKFLDYSPSTKVVTYQYIGFDQDKYMFDRRVGETIIGIKEGAVVTVIYNLIPHNDDGIVSKSTVELAQQQAEVTLLPLARYTYAASKGDILYSLSITNNEMTFDQGRIMYCKTIKYSVLIP